MMIYVPLITAARVLSSAHMVMQCMELLTSDRKDMHSGTPVAIVDTLQLGAW